MRKETLKRSLENVRALKVEIDSIKRSLKQIQPGFAMDTVSGSSPEFPYTKHKMQIAGYATIEHEKLTEELQKKLRHLSRQKRIAEKRFEEAENEIDHEMRAILRDYYINGQSQEKIASRLKYSRSAIAMKLQRFWENK